MGKRSNRRRPGETGKRGLEAAYRPTKTMVFHKSLKQNAALGKAPIRRVVTRNNHVFAALYALLKLERLKIKRRLRHFALRAHLYRKTIRAAHDEPQVLKAAQHQLLILSTHPTRGGFRSYTEQFTRFCVLPLSAKG